MLQLLLAVINSNLIKFLDQDSFKDMKENITLHLDHMKTLPV
jgi:hypothetical protein